MLSMSGLNTQEKIDNIIKQIKAVLEQQHSVHERINEVRTLTQQQVFDQTNKIREQISEF